MKAKPFGRATGCGAAKLIKTKRGPRCVRVCRNGQWQFVKTSECARRREAKR